MKRITKAWRYLLIGGAASWGCSEQPSFPSEFGKGGSDGLGSGGDMVPSGGDGPTGGTSGASGGTTSGGVTGEGGAIVGGAGGSMTTGGSGGSGPMAGSGGSGVLAGSGGAVAGSGSGVSGAGGAVAGSGGSGVSASGGGGAGPVAGAGAGGMMTDPQAEIDDAVKNLKGFRYENRCGYVDGHPLSTCTTGEVCWPNSTKARFTEKRDIAIGGRAGTVYDVTLRIRGVIEPRDYPTNCTRLPGGASNTIGVITNCDGFANRASVTFNVYEFKIPRPAAVYYFNAVPVHPPHRVDRIDQQFAIKVEGQSAITFTFDDLNGGEIRNCSLTVEGIAPYPQVFDGNYFQLDVVDARIAP